MLQSLQKSILLLCFTLMLCCVIYPLALWTVGQTIFPFQANGSMLTSDGKRVGSLLIAQSFTKDEYFHPRPSAASYDASASSSSALAASNYALRYRVANSLGPIVRYQSGAKAGQLVAPDIVQWFQQDKYEGKPHIVAQWAKLHPALAQAWVGADPLRRVQEIPAIFFDMWRQEHPDVKLQEVPGDMVTTSGSGLDPHITLQNALYQLDRVATQWASHLKRDPLQVKNEIVQLLNQKASAPFGGLVGEKIVNVLEVNLELHNRYGER